MLGQVKYCPKYTDNHLKSLNLNFLSILLAVPHIRQTAPPSVVSLEQIL